MAKCTIIQAMPHNNPNLLVKYHWAHLKQGYKIQLGWVRMVVVDNYLTVLLKCCRIGT